MHKNLIEHDKFKAGEYTEALEKAFILADEQLLGGGKFAFSLSPRVTVVSYSHLLIADLLLFYLQIQNSLSNHRAVLP